MSHSLLFLLTAFFMAILLYDLLFSWWNLRRIEIQATSEGDWTAGEPALLSVDLRGRRANAFDLHVYAKSKGARFTEFVLARFDPKSKRGVQLTATGHWRGRVQVDEVGVYSAYPFGLVLGKKAVVGPQDVLVLPMRLVRDEDTVREAWQESGSVPAVTGDFQYLDQYRQGEDVRYVHWKKSASRQQLVIRRDTQKTLPLMDRLFVPDPCPQLEYAIAWVAGQLGDDDDWTIWDGYDCYGPGYGNQRLAIMAEMLPVTSGPPHVDEMTVVVKASDLVPEHTTYPWFQARYESSAVFHEQFTSD